MTWFEKLKSNWYQVSFINTIWVPLFMQSEIIYQSQRSFEVKFLDRLKMPNSSHFKSWSLIRTIIMFWGVWNLIISDPTHDNDKIGWFAPNIYYLAMSFKILGSTASHPIFFATHSMTNKFGLNLSNFISNLISVEVYTCTWG